LLCLGPQQQALADLAKTGNETRTLEVVKVYVCPKCPLPDGPFFPHIGRGPVLLDKILVAIVDLLSLLPVVFGRLANNEVWLID